MRVAVLILGALLLAACSAPSAPLLTDAERCERFSGFYTMGRCRSSP